MKVSASGIYWKREYSFKFTLELARRSPVPKIFNIYLWTTGKTITKCFLDFLQQEVGKSQSSEFLCSKKNEPILSQDQKSVPDHQLRAMPKKAKSNWEEPKRWSTRTPGHSLPKSGSEAVLETANCKSLLFLISDEKVRSFTSTTHPDIVFFFFSPKLKKKLFLQIFSNSPPSLSPLQKNYVI